MQQQAAAARQHGAGSHDLGGQRAKARTTAPAKDDRDAHQAGWTDIDDDDPPAR